MQPANLKALILQDASHFHVADARVLWKERKRIFVLPKFRVHRTKERFFHYSHYRKSCSNEVLNSKLRPIVLSVFDRSGRECIGLKTRSNLVEYTTDSIARLSDLRHRRAG